MFGEFYFGEAYFGEGAEIVIISGFPPATLYRPEAEGELSDSGLSDIFDTLGSLITDTFGRDIFDTGTLFTPIPATVFEVLEILPSDVYRPPFQGELSTIGTTDILDIMNSIITDTTGSAITDTGTLLIPLPSSLYITNDSI